MSDIYDWFIVADFNTQQFPTGNGGASTTQALSVTPAGTRVVIESITNLHSTGGAPAASFRLGDGDGNPITSGGAAFAKTSAVKQGHPFLLTNGLSAREQGDVNASWLVKYRITK